MRSEMAEGMRDIARRKRARGDGGIAARPSAGDVVIIVDDDAPIEHRSAMAPALSALLRARLAADPAGADIVRDAVASLRASGDASEAAHLLRAVKRLAAADASLARALAAIAAGVQAAAADALHAELVWE